MSDKNEIILYQAQKHSTRIEVRVEGETVWLNRQQLGALFGRDIKTIGKHINNVLKEELKGFSVVAKFATTASDGKIYQTEYYNLEMIISIGYRVKSTEGIQFRIWANEVLKDYLLKGYSFNQRMNRIESNIDTLTDKIDLQINTSLLPTQGILYDGQEFEAYTFVSNLIRSAKKSIILIDNYIDDTVLTHFTKRNKNVNFSIFTKKISKQLKLDIEKHNQQYQSINIKEFAKAHDRFLIIDNYTVYHFGASLKDLGKKWFAFSKMNMEAMGMIAELGNDTTKKRNHE